MKTGFVHKGLLVPNVFPKPFFGGFVCSVPFASAGWPMATPKQGPLPSSRHKEGGQGIPHPPILGLPFHVASAATYPNRLSSSIQGHHIRSSSGADLGRVVQKGFAVMEVLSHSRLIGPFLFLKLSEGLLWAHQVQENVKALYDGFHLQRAALKGRP